MSDEVTDTSDQQETEPRVEPASGPSEVAAPEGAKTEAAKTSRLDSARERFTKVTSGVEERLGKLKRDAGGAGARVRERAGHARTTARERYDSTLETVRHGYGKAQKDLEHLTEDVNEYVRHNPGRSVLIAAGVGFLLGMLMRGGRR